MYCSKCGKSVSDDASFCGSCGEKIEVHNEAENIVAKPTEKVVTKKTDVKKKIIFIAIAAIAVVGLLITNFIINPHISGPEVLYGLEWGMTYDQVKAVDSSIRQLEFNSKYDEHFREDRYGALSTIGYDYMHICSNVSGAVITYYFGVNNSLERIEIQYAANAGQKYKYDFIMKKLEKYYNAVCKVSPTKGTSAHGGNSTLIWNTAKNNISVGGDFGSTDYVIVNITPAK